MRHNKSGDIFLVFDRLMKVVSKSIIFETKSNLRDASIAKSILENHFKKNSLYEYIKSALVISEWKLEESDHGKADIMLQEIRDHIRESINYNEYIKDKICFLNEVKKVFDIDLLLLERMDNYKIIASTHLFLEDCIASKINKDIKNIENRIKIKSYLINEIVKQKQKLPNVSEITEFIKSNNISPSIIKFTNNAFADELKEYNPDIRDLIENFAYHTNTDEFIKLIRLKIQETNNEIKNIAKNLKNIDTKNIFEITKKMSDVEKSINYDNYESVLQKLCEAIELKFVLQQENN